VLFCSGRDLWKALAWPVTLVRVALTCMSEEAGRVVVAADLILRAD
jgi:hypothetical protein